MIKLHFKFRPYPSMPNRECFMVGVNLNDHTHTQLANAIKRTVNLTDGYPIAIDAGPNAELQVWPGAEVTLAYHGKDVGFNFPSEPLSTKQFLRAIANAPEV